MLTLVDSLLNRMIPCMQSVLFGVDVLGQRTETDITIIKRLGCLSGFSKDEIQWNGQDQKPWRSLRPDVTLASAWGFD